MAVPHPCALAAQPPTAALLRVIRGTSDPAPPDTRSGQNRKPVARSTLCQWRAPTLSCRVEKRVPYPQLCEMSEPQRREFHEALLDADRFEDLPGKSLAAILKADRCTVRAAMSWCYAPP
jgi:hypothetical protein